MPDETAHTIELTWRQHPHRPDMSLNGGTCSCGWATGFESTDKDSALNAMRDHARHVQPVAASEHHAGFTR